VWFREIGERGQGIDTCVCVCMHAYTLFCIYILHTYICRHIHTHAYIQAWWPHALYIGLDIADIHAAQGCEAVRASMKRIVLRENSVDHVLCDVPFGRQHGVPSLKKQKKTSDECGLQSGVPLRKKQKKTSDECGLQSHDKQGVHLIKDNEMSAECGTRIDLKQGASLPGKQKASAKSGAPSDEKPDLHLIKNMAVSTESGTPNDKKPDLHLIKNMAVSTESETPSDVFEMMRFLMCECARVCRDGATMVILTGMFRMYM
jgi:hypothetical protein